MANSDAPVLPLPPEVTKKIQSSARITGLNEVVVELIKNALDADARSFNIIVDYGRGGCVVEDDGHGLPPAEFRAGSGLCRAHNTSKSGRHSVSSCKGLFLSALATMSILTISSRHHSQSQTNTAIFHSSETLARLVPAPTHQEIQGDHGTRVTVNNLFGNMPVRVKHRASSLQRPEDIDKELEELKRNIVALALSNTHLQKLRLAQRGRSSVLHLRIPSIHTGILQSETASPDILRLQTIFSQSGLILSASVSDWVLMSASTLNVSVKAYVALSSSPTKLNQFISLGINPIFNAQSNTNVLYNAINDVFLASDFGLSETSCEEDGASITAEKPVLKLKGSAKGTRRWPMFYLRIDSPNAGDFIADYDSIVGSDRILQHMIEVLHAMFYQFLEQHHYRPRKRRKATFESEAASHSRNAIAMPLTGFNQQTKSSRSLPSVRLAPTSISSDAFDSSVRLPAFVRMQSSHYFKNFTNWSRVKSGNDKTIEDLMSFRLRKNDYYQSTASLPEADRTASTSIQSDELLFDRTGRNQHTRQEISSEPTRWIDSRINNIVIVNSKTGQCSAAQPRTDRHITSDGIVRPRSTGSVLRQNESIKRPQSAPARGESLWFENLANYCADPVFPQLERPIMSFENSNVFGSQFITTAANASQENWCRSWDFAGGTGDRNQGRGKLCRKGLAEAEVIAQVDRKFILVRMATDDNKDHGPEKVSNKADKMLVLIDQHAADERCRLEQLLSEIFVVDEDSANISIRIHQLPTSIQHRILDEEAAPFQSYAKYFESWGCHYKIVQEVVGTKRQSAIRIDALPLVIVDRCRLEPKIFVDILRKEVWSKAGDRIPRSRPSKCMATRTNAPAATTAESNKSHNNNFPWLHWIAGCPEGITDLISSRACRSSIMFNDPLAIRECESLISRLSLCAFPFQCAHGRPTMIPIFYGGRYCYPPCSVAAPTPPFANIAKLGKRKTDDDNHNERRAQQQEQQKQEQELGFVEAFRNWEMYNS